MAPAGTPLANLCSLECVSSASAEMYVIGAFKDILLMLGKDRGCAQYCSKTQFNVHILDLRSIVIMKFRVRRAASCRLPKTPLCPQSVNDRAPCSLRLKTDLQCREPDLPSIESLSTQ